MNRQHVRGRLAIIAGSGQLPHHVAAAATAAGDQPFMVLLDGEVSGDWSAYPSARLGTGDLRALKTVFKQQHIGRVIMSGGIARRPVLSEIRPSLGSWRKLPAILRNLVAGGDNSVLTMVIGLIEAEGVQVIGVHDIVPNLLAKAGTIGTHSPSSDAVVDIEVAIQAARLLGRLDIGQGAVAVGGRVVALEGPEGTDAMLARVYEMRREGRISSTKAGVLVKLCKLGQDLRVDLPSVGLSTFVNAKAAGLAGIAMESGRSLLLDHDVVCRFADENGMFLLGLQLDSDEVRRGERP